jgi:hypothetical protein
VVDAIVKDNKLAQQMVDGLQAGYRSTASSTIRSDSAEWGTRRRLG